MKHTNQIKCKTPIFKRKAKRFWWGDDLVQRIYVEVQICFQGSAASKITRAPRERETRTHLQKESIFVKSVLRGSTFSKKRKILTEFQVCGRKLLPLMHLAPSPPIWVQFSQDLFCNGSLLHEMNMPAKFENGQNTENVTTGLDRANVSSEEFIRVDDDDACKDLIMADKDILEFVQSS
ncbi:hypothetical protein TNCV_3374721 [Trichonephila clavipes]|nr:hypothetical protein TNCV_3374721 [Trichonephila clavipes]